MKAAAVWILRSLFISPTIFSLEQSHFTGYSLRHVRLQITFSLKMLYSYQQIIYSLTSTNLERSLHTWFLFSTNTSFVSV